MAAQYSFMIGGSGSGSGKTTLTLALLRLLARAGVPPVPCKCGPDYIDPLLHRQAAGRPSRNLDCFFGNAAAGFAAACAEGDAVVVEGVMGLFDGVRGGDLAGSSAELAAALGIPVLLTVNARGLSGSIAPLVAGFANWHPGVRIAGVLADQVGSDHHAALLKEALAAAHLPPLLGWLPRDERWLLPERHLGLTLANLAPEWLDALADTLAHTLDLPALLAATHGDYAATPPPKFPSSTHRIGVAWDDAFCFYYQGNFEALRRHGAELCFFSPLKDAALPPDLDALYLGGGYPELHAEALDANSVLAAAIRDFAQSHPVYGECGGYMWMLEGFTDFGGRFHPGLGLLPGRARMNRRLAALGYRTVEGEQGSFRGHEFHYSSLEAPPPGPPLWQCRDLHGHAFSAGSRRGFASGSYIHLWFGEDTKLLE